MTDVAVYGATGAGVMAAVAAQAAGADTVLIEPGDHVGGMVSGGLSWTDVGDLAAIGGLARRFYELVAEHYGVRLWGVKGPEPHVAEAILVSLLEDVDVRLSETSVPDAAVYIDASYEGDLMASFGVPYAVGRESRELYGERWAGRQPAYRPGKHNFGVLLSPFADDGCLLPHIREPELDEEGWPAERLGDGDGGLQAYAFRVCLTDREENRLPVEPPEAYDPAAFELLARYLDATGDPAPLGLVRDLLPNGKCDVNSIGPFSLNVLDGTNRGYPDGDGETRGRVREHHLRYTQGFLWFLSERGLLEGWGLCADEFEDTGGWPHQLYVRDGRRMLGAYVLTEHDLTGARAQRDAIALGSYNIDIREVERTWRALPEYTRTPAVFNEGYLSIAVPRYPIPYRSLTPRREDADNLLVPVCLSASHVAFGSVRMEPTLMELGQVAGRAAAQAARRGLAVQDVDVAALQDEVPAL
ncbi:MAG TPA: FAD-dependent oxidoreductase [Gaiellaceae bacterium]|nr:FAD-dependent oxidoreductase [Gaiellaceae bacterium]